jgi:hypothetical protein
LAVDIDHCDLISGLQAEPIAVRSWSRVGEPAGPCSVS